MLIAILHFIADADDPYRSSRRLLDALPAGSYLVASHATNDFSSPAVVAAYDTMLTDGRIDFWARDHAEIAALLRRARPHRARRRSGERMARRGRTTTPSRRR